jgi:hypothetical protein
MQKYIVNDCPACKPISGLLDLLLEAGFQIVEEKLSDYHFRELYFKLKGDLEKAENIRIEGIEKFEKNKYNCSCHWSVVEIVQS